MLHRHHVLLCDVSDMLLSFIGLTIFFFREANLLTKLSLASSWRCIDKALVCMMKLANVVHH
jgi:hypothetical protein